MPFVARVRETGERLDMTRLADPREVLAAYKVGEIVCQICGEAMVPKIGMIVRPHFAHKPRTECDHRYDAHPESPEHLEGKALIAGFLRDEWADTGVRVELEVPIPEVNRIADVMAIFPNGWRIAYECQLASIVSGTLSQRTKDYLHAGVDVVWWLGKSAATDGNREWCLDYQGAVYELHFAARRKTSSQHAKEHGFSYRDVQGLAG